MHPSLSPFDLAILAVFVILTTWQALRSSRGTKAADYFMAGRRSRWPVIGLTLFVASISCGTLIGNASEGFIGGIVVFNYNLISVFVMVFFALFFIPFFIGARIDTIPEFLGRRFDDRSRLVLSGVALAGNVFIDMASSIYTGALLLHIFFPAVGFVTIIVAIAVLSGVSAVIGGLASGMRTDLIRSAVLLGGSVMLALFCLRSAGGWGAFTEHFHEGVWLRLVRGVDDPTIPWPGMMLGIPIVGFYFWGNNQILMQRVLSARSIDDGRKGILLNGFLYLFTLFIFIVPGAVARMTDLFGLGDALPLEIIPGRELQETYGIQTNEVYPRLVLDLLPAGLIGVIIAAMVSGLTAGISAALNSVSTLFTMDFYARGGRVKDPRKLLRTGRIVSLTALGVAMLWAPLIGRFDSLIGYYIEMNSYIAPPVVGIFLLGLFWKRCNAQGALASLLAGFGAGLVVMVLKHGFGVPIPFHFLVVAPMVMGFSMLVAVVVSHFTPAPPQEKTVELTWDRSYWRAETRALKGVRWYSNFRVLAAALVVLCIIELVIFW